MRLVDFDPQHERVWLGRVVRVEEGQKRRAVGDGARGECVRVCVETPVVPEEEVAEEVGAEDVVRVGVVDLVEVGDCV